MISIFIKGQQINKQLDIQNQENNELDKPKK